MPPSTTVRLALACLLPLASAACAAPQAGDPPGPPEPPIVEPSPRLVLLGEVHDNAEGHRQRLEAVRGYTGSDDFPVVIAMEQFDRERQADLDAAMARCADAACVIEAASPDKAGWNWDFYAPVIQHALDHDIPLVAANLSRADASKVVKEGFDALPRDLRDAFGLDRPLPEALLSAQVEAVREGHCNMLPESLLEPMARAQVARDVAMADAMLRALPETGGVVLLLAGNGHVKRDIAVPWWLRGSGEQWVAVGYLETPVEPGAYRWFDSIHEIPPAEREDPCAAFKAPKAPAERAQ